MTSSITTAARARAAGALLMFAVLAGCGTTRWTDTSRTATEQLLISDAVDRSVSELDFTSIRGRKVFFDAQYLKGATDENYVISTLRQHILASGCILKEKREDATYIVEARSGAVGTDRADVLYGIPATNLPPLVGMPSVPTAIPEIALGRKTEQHGVAKLAVFVYNRVTGRLIWQSGASNVVSDAKDIWVLGIGPIRRGTIYARPQFVGSDAAGSWLVGGGSHKKTYTPVRVARQLYFNEEPRSELSAEKPAPEADDDSKRTAAAPNDTAVAPPPAARGAAPLQAEASSEVSPVAPPNHQPLPHRWSEKVQRLPDEPPRRVASPPRYFF